MTDDTPTLTRIQPTASMLADTRDGDDPSRRLVPVPDDETDVPRETLDILGQARDALTQLITGVFQAAEAIVTALLQLVQSIAGRDVAEAVDRGVAEVLDPLVPDLPPTSEQTPEAPSASPSEAPAPVPPTSPAPLRDEVRGVLLDHATSDEERIALTPAFVSMVTTGVQFALSVERQFPGAIDALQAGEVIPTDGLTEADRAVDQTAEPRSDEADTSLREAAVAY